MIKDFPVLLIRSIAISIVGHLCLHLDEESSHLTTQLNIVCKNLASALRAFSTPDLHVDNIAEKTSLDGCDRPDCATAAAATLRVRQKSQMISMP